MRSWKVSCLMVAALLCACQKPSEAPPKAPAAPAATEHEPHAESATNWTTKTELFVEYPPLVAGKVSRFAIHLTRMDNFKAVTRGSAEVRLNGQHAFRSEAPSRPGIFGIDVKPGEAGETRVAIRFTGEGIDDTHDLGLLPVAASQAAAAHEHGDDPDSPNKVAFLKEQQWTLDFGTSVVEDKALHSSLRVPAEVTARSGGIAEVDSPFDGRVMIARMPVIGSTVQAGQVLAQVTLPVSAPSDPAGLELARKEAEAALQLARKDHARAERLTQSGAVPAKRLDEAVAVVATAEARHAAAKARIDQFEASRQADSPSGALLKPFAIKAPVSGVIQAVLTVPGANVKAGDTLFRVIDLDSLYVSAIVPESEYHRIAKLSGAELEIPGAAAPRRLTQLVTIGRVVDPATRTFPVTYQIDNRDRRVAVNQNLHLRLLFEATAVAPVIPESAIVDDNGRPLVFIQLSGETFLRRPVKLGQRTNAFVQALEGVNPGERVVTRGAHLIRLASMSNQVPAHGHVH